SLVYIRDLVNGFALAGESDKAVGQTYFISSEKLYTWDEVGDVTKFVMKKKAVTLRVPHTIIYAAGGISEVIGRFRDKPPIFNYEKARDITQQYWTCDISKAERDLGYHQEVDLETGIRETVEWYKKMKWL
ncbi:MAG TPA: NAD(P)-dependent oxidoreductase, partial [Candidatus Kapabacteria bacterium]|nr:NAD(P)-dependent oxidoreductase [Candidatus Kapabacteria bacterium]